MPSSPRDPRVFHAQLELVYRLTERSQIAAFAISTAFLTAFHAPGPAWTVLVWWLTLNGIALVRIFLGRRFLASDLRGWTLDQWAIAIAAGSLGSGLSWGFFLLFFAPTWGDAAYPISVFMAAGIPAVSLLANAGLLPAYVLIVVPILVPYALKLIFQAGSGSELLAGVAALVYAGVFLVLGRLVNHGIVESFRLRFHNEDLVRSLSVTNAELATEIAGREAIEAGLRRATESAESANAAKSRFLARMSHEIRTPLNGILGMTEILRETSLSPDQLEHADTIQEAGRSLLQVINDILDFSKVEAGKLSLRAADFSVRDVVLRAVALLRPRVTAKGLRLDVDIAPAVPELVSGDSGRLRQILINLLGNAEKFTLAGQIRVAVFPVDPEGDPNELFFEVRDTGVGIPEEAQGRLFQPFSQVDESRVRPHGGTGLGLAISHQLVELMKGTMGVESEPGKGSRFWFSARFLPPNRSGEQRRSVALAAGEILGSLSGHVLLVDDNTVNRLICASFLERLGCTFEEAKDGEEAARLVSEKSFDAILMDCEMPILDGYEATSRIRRAEKAEGSGRELPIVALTASALLADRERALAAGMNEYLTKPFTFVDLHRVLSVWLRPPLSQTRGPVVEAGDEKIEG